MTAAMTSGDTALLSAALSRDQRAWREFVSRFNGQLREAVRAAFAAHEEVGEDQIDDVLADFWLRIVENDMRILRSYDPARGLPLLAWLAVRATRLALSQRQADRGPALVPLDEAPEPRDLSPLPDASPGVTCLTTAEACRYLRYQTDSGIRNAVRRGELVPVGWGPRGKHLFTVAELDRLVLFRAQAAHHDRKDSVENRIAAAVVRELGERGIVAPHDQAVASAGTAKEAVECRHDKPHPAFADQHGSRAVNDGGSSSSRRARAKKIANQLLDGFAQKRNSSRSTPKRSSKLASRG
jgi:hypothetical protein